MQPIIRRTITITVTETWTITWPDGQETVWTETQDWPADPESSEALLPLNNDDEIECGVLDPDDLPAADAE